MSLVAKAKDVKSTASGKAFNRDVGEEIISRLARLEEQISSAKVKGKGKKGDATKYVRDELECENIYVFPFEKTDKSISIGIMQDRDQEVMDYIIEVQKPYFDEIVRKFKNANVDTHIQIKTYVLTDKTAVKTEEGWVFSESD